jgi:small subunit ribosomal protein S20
MANTKSAQKAFRSSIKKNEVNTSRISRIRTFVRKVKDAIKVGDEKNAREAFKNLEPEIMRGVTKKVLKLNTAARKLRRLGAAIRKIKAANEPVVETNTAKK